MSELVAVRIIRHLRCSVDHGSLVWMKSSYLWKDEEIRLWPQNLSKLCDVSNSDVNDFTRTLQWVVFKP